MVDDQKTKLVARLLSVNVGLPREIEWRGKTVRTAIRKDPVQGRRIVRRVNIDGDGQGDLAGHGGEQRAVLVYQIDSYRYWQNYLGRPDFTFGQFGENLTVDGLSDSEVCIGDRFRIGTALLEVTQPRVTCYRVGIRMDEPRMASLLVAHGRPGFYCRVVEEGDLGTGDEIVQVAAGSEQMTVATINGLLYLPGHSRDQLERALRIPALSPGWQTSFQALLQQHAVGNMTAGNAGLVSTNNGPASSPGFRSLRVSRIDRESSSVISIVFEPADGVPLAPALPGQFVVLRLRSAPAAPPLFRSYSLSCGPSTEFYRVSIKREQYGAASNYLHHKLTVGDVLDVSSPRGSFTLQSNDRPVVLISAGVGATPALGMLHALADEATQRQVWWLFAARSGDEHPFSKESRQLLQIIPSSRGYIFYSQPGSEDRAGVNYDAAGHITVEIFEKLGIPHDADFYICGPPAFMQKLIAGISDWGVPPNRVYTEIFGPGKSHMPGVIDASSEPPHPPTGMSGKGPRVSFARSGLSVCWSALYSSLLELAEACDVPANWSCRTGVCHQCESGLISGKVNYLPSPLEPPAAGNILMCCSQPQDDIVIDL